MSALINASTNVISQGVADRKMFVEEMTIVGLVAAGVAFVILSFVKNLFMKTALVFLGPIAIGVLSFEVPYQTYANEAMSGVGAAATVLTVGFPAAMGWLAGGVLSYVIR
jgi:hypothetical protein